MTTLLLSHPACLNHLTPMGHPERPDRLRAVERTLEHEKFQSLAREQAPMASLDVIARVHPMDYVEQVRDASPREGMVRLDADTTMSPGTFEAVLRGARNTTVNAPLRPGDGGEQFREAVETTILPRLDDFAPDLVIISAGFDAHMRDPLANLNFLEADYAWVTQKLMDVADRHGNGRVVSVLEGGYDLEGLSKSLAAHVTALMRV